MMDRFERQYILPGFGEAAQQKLRDAKVLVIGAGGLGCPALLYLAAAGIGTLGIIDGDKVALSNLNRQVLFGEGDVGKSKAEVAGKLLCQKYSDCTVHIIPQFITVENALDIIKQYDLVLDGSDNFPTRYLVNDACVLLGKPLILGAIYQHEGQVTVLNATKENPANYRDIYPEPPGAHEVPNCNETGVLGVLPGLIGTMLATETIKYLCGYGEALINKMLFYDIRTHNSYVMQIVPTSNAEQAGPRNAEEFKQMNYPQFCGISQTITWEHAVQMLSQENQCILVDVRELHETPKIKTLTPINLPLSGLDTDYQDVKEADKIVLFCQSGIRSQKAAAQLSLIYPEKIFYSIEGGVSSPESPVTSLTHGN